MLLFDSIAHPTIDGCWFGKTYNNTFEQLAQQYIENGIAGGCAVSLPMMSIEELQAYYNKCMEQKQVQLYPVAAINFDESDLREKIRAIREMGYKAVKIHTRLSKIDFDKDIEKLKTAFRACEEQELIIFFCTYYHTTIELTPIHPLSYYLIRLLKSAPRIKIILLHGGDVNLLQLSQLARFNPNILIDLSYTFLKFKDSSLGTDILFLMQHLDKKICFGSDYPEYPVAVFREEVDRLCEKITDEEKKKHIRYQNLRSFLNINQ